MGDFIGVDILDVLIGGTPVINLIKIHAVVPAGGIGHSVLLVQQHAVYAGDIQQLTASVIQGQLTQLHGEHPGHNTDVAGFDGGVADAGILPLKEIRVALVHGGIVDVAVFHGLGGGIDEAHPVAAVGAIVEVIISGVQSGVVHDRGDFLLLSQVDDHAVVFPLKGIKALGILRAAQIGEGYHRVNGEDHDHRQQIPPLHGIAPAVQGKTGLVKILNPLQGPHARRHFPLVF